MEISEIRNLLKCGKRGPVPAKTPLESIYCKYLLYMQHWVIRSQILGKNFDLSTHCLKGHHHLPFPTFLRCELVGLLTKSHFRSATVDSIWHANRNCGAIVKNPKIYGTQNPVLGWLGYYEVMVFAKPKESKIKRSFVGRPWILRLPIFSLSQRPGCCGKPPWRRARFCENSGAATMHLLFVTEGWHSINGAVKGMVTAWVGG